MGNVNLMKLKMIETGLYKKSTIPTKITNTFLIVNHSLLEPTVTQWNPLEFITFWKPSVPKQTHKKTNQTHKNHQNQPTPTVTQQNLPEPTGTH